MNVHFIHGLEGHSRGSKVIALEKQGFAVRAPEMHMSLWGWQRRNAMVRNLVRLPETRIVGGLALAGVLHAAWTRSGVRMGLALGLPAGWLAVRRKALVAQALGRSYESCLALQRTALASSRPEVLIGSSWGGALAVDLIREGSWTGPTVLLAPAWARVRAWTGRTREMFQPPTHQPIVLFHDPSDATVSVMDSLRLAAGTAIDARFVNGGGHRLMGLVESGELARCLRAMASRRQGAGMVPGEPSTSEPRNS